MSGTIGARGDRAPGTAIREAPSTVQDPKMDLIMVDKIALGRVLTLSHAWNRINVR